MMAVQLLVPTTNSVTLSGTAVKGIIQSGIVTATELSSTGTSLGIVGTALTDENGQYNLELTDAYQGGVVKLTITAGTNTTMKCDATDGCGTGQAFGSDVSLSEGFSLDAIVQPATGAEAVSVQITPLTHMATARALQNSVIDATSVNSAINEVGQIVGVDIMGSPIVDITSATSLASASEASKKLALFNAGLADLLVKESATGNSIQQNISDNLEKLASSFSDGQFDDTDSVKITDITTAVGNALTNVASNEAIKNALSDSIQDVQTIVSVVEGDLVDGVYNPEPSSTADASDIEKGKALLTSARTFIETIATDFEEPLDALNIDADAVATVLDQDTAVMGELLGEAIDQSITHLDGLDIDIIALLESDQPTATYNIPIIDDDEQSIGSMTAVLNSDTTGISITLNGSLTGEQDVDIDDLKLATNLTESDLSITDGLLNAITSNSVQIKVTGDIGNDDTSLTLTDVSLTLTASETVTLDTSEDGDNDGLEDKVSSASFVGDFSIMSHGASFMGEAEISLIALTDSSSADMPLSLQKIDVNGTFNSATKGSFTAGAMLTIDNATSFDTFGYLDYDSSAYYSSDYNNYSLTSSDLAIVNTYTNVALDSETYFNIDYNDYDDVYTVHYNTQDLGWITTEISEDLPDLGSAAMTAFDDMNTDNAESTNLDWLHYENSDGYFNAGVNVRFSDFESADNFVQGTLTLMATADLPELAAYQYRSNY
ncbi:hypothetical protein ACLKMH_23870 [Psychromonas sp. KJ10-10]|uniref:hypothetical protein n=1 Tax=Psychromonas sp. KJ10-10 TaxID=3391823 RepID=UPI0039B61CDF